MASIVGALAGCSCSETPTAVAPPEPFIPIAQPYVIEVTGEQYRWQIRHPGSDGMLHTSDDVVTPRDIHIPAETDVSIVVKSSDYVYSLAIPDFKLHEMAVPQLELRMNLRTGAAGEFPLIGDEFCGDPHPELTGSVVVESRDAFRTWLLDQSRQSALPSVP
jgi:heme/copper-type cytochrome/quinol oxidase subunit 2